MKAVMKRGISLVLVICLSITFAPVFVFHAEAASYDATAAVNFANSHWNDGIGLCAEFVSRCLNAGGISIPNQAYYSSSTQSYQNNSGTLGRFTNPYIGSAPLLLYLSQYYTIITNPSASQIAVGDVVFMYSGEWRDGHVGIIISTSGGVPVYAAHNRATNTGQFYSNYPCTYVVKMGGSTGPHTHSYTISGREAAHPHKIYKQCTCGDFYYTGETTTLSTCSQCNGHTLNTAYSTYLPIHAYPISAGNISVYDVNGNKYSNRYIDGSTDLCIIREVYTDGWCYVSYPSSSESDGYFEAYVKLDQFIPSANPTAWTSNGNYTAYRRSDLSAVLGNIVKGDKCLVVSVNGKLKQVAYPVDGANYYKMGWITANTMPTPVLTTAKNTYAKGENVQIKWNDVPENTLYWINVYRNGTIIVDQSMQQLTSYTLQNAQPGEYVVYVSAGNALGRSELGECTFTVSETPTLTGVSVVSNPTKTNYVKGQTLDMTGLKLKATYSDGSTEEITSGFTCSPTTLNTAGKQTVTVTYQGKTASFAVSVEDVTLNKIDISSKPTKTTYCVGETLDTTGLKLKLTYNDGTTKTVTSGFTCSPTTLRTAGTQTVTAAYGGKTTTFTVQVDSHNYSYQVSMNPTLSLTGILECTCTRCKAETTVTLPKLGTTAYSCTVKTAATCTMAGIECYTWKTTTYGTFSFDVPILAKGHTEVTDNAVAATCTASGKTEGKHCSVCNTVIVKQETVPAKGHSWDNGKITTVPTEESTGVRTYTCTICSETKTETVPALDHVHSYMAVVTAPTCTEKGYTTYTCRCGDTYIADYVNAKGHSEVIDKAAAATCTATGKTEGKHCSVCSAVLVKQEVIPTIGHSYNYAVTENPTSSSTGLLTGTCSGCKGTVTEILPKLNTEDYTYTVIQKPTETTAGRGQYVWKEKVYGEFVIEVTLDKLGPDVAPDAAQYTAEPCVTSAGQEVEVVISVKNNPGMISLRNRIVYDASVMELVKVEDTGLLKGWTAPAPTISSPYTLRWADALTTQNNTQNGDLVKLTFRIKDTVAAGDYSFAVETVEARNAAGEKVSIANLDVKIAVVDYVPGDADGDGEVTDWDAIILDRYLAGWDVEISAAAADADGDGEITDWDSILLSRYLAGWDVWLGK